MHHSYRTAKYFAIQPYAGALLISASLGLSFSNWFALGFGTMPFIVVALIACELKRKR